MRARADFAARLRVVPLLFLALFFVVPVIGAFARFLRPSRIIDVLGDSSLRSVAWFTSWQAIVSTTLTLAIGMPLTWALSRRAVRWSRLLSGIVTAPFLMPAVVVATGIAALVPSRGIPAIIAAHVVFNVAVILRVVGPRWSMLPSVLEDTAADLGAGPWRTFTHVTWPMISSAVVAAASLVFVFCWSSYAVVAVLGGPTIRTLETEVVVRALRLGDVRTAVALSLLQSVIVFSVLYATARWHNRDLSDTETADPSHHRPVSRYATTIAWSCTALVITPMVAVGIRSVRMSGRWSLAGWRALFDGSLERVGVQTAEVLGASLRFAVAASALSVLLAIAAVRRDRPSLVERLSLAPLVVSAVTLGLGIIITFDRAPVEWRASSWLLPVVHAVVAFPLVVRVIGPAVRALDPALIHAARDLGAGRARTLLCIELPLVRSAVLRATGIAAAVSLGEFGATSFLTRSGSTTIPIAIAQLMGRPGTLLQHAAFALSTLTAIACALLLAGV